eukprot:3934766-Rhodomonas_salina.2
MRAVCRGTGHRVLGCTVTDSHRVPSPSPDTMADSTCVRACFDQHSGDQLQASRSCRVSCPLCAVRY